MPLKRVMILFAFCFHFGNIFAQSGTNTAGKSIYSSTGEMSYNLGEINYVKSGGNINLMSSGVFQVYVFIPLSIALENRISLWPNPVKETLFFKIDSTPLQAINLQLFDIYGHLLDSQNIQEITTSLNMIKYPMGTYFIKLIFENQTTITYKIFKF